MKKFINYKFVEYDEQRIGSLFAYPNTMGAICGLGIFLNIGYIWKCKNIKSKVFYAICSIIMLVTMILTYSRFVYILFALIAILYMLILFKKYNIKKKITKTKAIILIVFCIILVTYIIIGLNISTELKIDNEYQKIMYEVKPNEKYDFSFDIQTNSNSKEKESFLIKITEKNKYFDDINAQKIEFGTYTGTKTLEIQTKAETSVIYINIENKETDSKFIVNNARLNEKQLILKYKILPTKIIQKIQGISLKNKSLWERATFIKDGIKAIEQNWIFGLGGKAWETIQSKTQSYSYYAQEMHSFPVKVFIENGILGFVACIGVAIYLIKILVKECKEKEINMFNISILIAISFLLLHSIIDFDLSFFYCILVSATMIATISSKENGKQIKLSNVIYIILIIVSLINIYSTLIQMSYKEKARLLKVNSKWTEERIFETYYKLLPYNRTIKNRYYGTIKDDNQRQKIREDLIKNEKYDILNLSLENIYLYIEQLIKNNEGAELFEKSLNYVEETEEFYKYNPNYQISRLSKLKEIVELLNENNFIEYAQKFENQLIKEIEEKEQDILNYEKSRYYQEYVELYKEQIEKLK